ncbi:hypothetical protein Cni_G06194 [Canna indica]|uniref:SWIM-type domain-containing protein n=1 Tax=Canna indica TaxID=4628 RepID=A0AAQ3JWH6_9LILI|nr:hypothetical protein Cni_G06194 [Canna indica]
METPRNSNDDSSEDEEYCPIGESNDVLSSEFESLSDEEYVICRAIKKGKRKNVEIDDSESNENLGNIPVIVEERSNNNMTEEVLIAVQPTTLGMHLHDTIDQTNEGTSEYENTSDEVSTPASSEEGVLYTEDTDSRRKKVRQRVYNPNCELQDVVFEVGMKFESNTQFKQVVQNYSIVNDYNIKWSKSCPQRMEAKCTMGCPWRIYASWLKNEMTIMVKAYANEHNCSRNMRNRQATGLEYAIKQRVLVAEHQNCARHIYANWKKKHNGHVLKSCFWRIVRCTVESESKRALNELAAISRRAYEDFNAIGVQKFCQAFISTQCKCEVVMNNICETFNGYILRARSKPLIDMLEDIRCMLMARMHAKKEIMSKSNDDICPSIRKKLEKNKTETNFCHVTPAGNMKFEVQELDRSYAVNLYNRTCSCRYWDICGIPYKHAISCISWLKEDPDQYVDNYYKRETYLKTYEFLIEPLTGKDT